MKLNEVIFVLILLMFLATFALDGYKMGRDNQNNYTRMIIQNPFSRSFSIDVKCNWNGKRYLFDKKFKLKGMSGTEVMIPNSSKCIIWPVL